MFYFLLGLLSTLAYLLAGAWIAEMFGEIDRTAWVMAWPVVVVWLIGVLSEDRADKRGDIYVG